MQSRTIRQTTLFLCLCLSTFLQGQITIDYPERLRVECGIDLTPAQDNPIIGYPEVSTTCAGGLTDITFSDNIDQLSECGGTGILLRFWSVSDNCGGFMTLLQRIILEDTTPPEINCIPDIIIECEASLNPTENPDLGFPEITDCSEGENLTINYVDQNEGDGFCDNLPEIVRRTWTVTDACGNSSTCEQTIRVGKDPLLVFCEIENILHECNGLDGSRFAAESWDLSNTNQLRNCTQTDCGPVEIISDFDYGRIAGSCGITGSFEVNYLIKDNCGNSRFKTVSFTLRDTTPPESFCNPIDFGVSCEGDETAATRVAGWHTDNLALLETCLFDNCGEVVVTSDFNADNFDISTLNFDCNDETGFAVNYILTDDCGNTTTKTAFLKVVDNAPPTFENVPRDTSIGASDNLAIGQPTILDNCSANVTSEFMEARIDNDNDDGYEIIRTWTATDDCGNMNTATQRIMVLDPILSLACSSAEVKLETDKIIISNLLAPNEIVKVFASDNRVVYNCFRNCGEVQTTRTLAPDTYKVEIEFYTAQWRLICSSEAIITVEGTDDTGGDDNGNDGNSDGDNDNNDDPCTGNDCEQEPPVLNNLPADLTVDVSAIPTVINPTVTDNCDTDVDIQFGEDRADNETDNNYVLTRTWTATDNCGNTATGQQVILVLNEVENNDPCATEDCETIPPIIDNIPADVTVNFDAVPAPAQPIAIDNCDTDVDLSMTETIPESTDSRNYVLVRTWTATDDCENTTTAQQTINVTGENDTDDNNADGGNDGDNNSGGDNNDGDNSGGDNDNSGDNNNNNDNSEAESCAAITINLNNNTITVDNINAPNKIVKLFDVAYNIIEECSADCSESISFNDLSIGNYFVDVQLYSADWVFICELQEAINIATTTETDDGAGDNGENGNDSDNETDNNNSNDGESCAAIAINLSSNTITVDNINAPNKIIKLFDIAYNIIEECSNDCSESISFNDLAIGNYFVDVQLYSADWVFICETQEAINVTTTAGTDDENGNNEGTDDNTDDETDNNQSDDPCENVNISHTTTAITLTNFSTTNKIINIFDANYNQVFNCFTDCLATVEAAIPDTGTYIIDIQLYTNEWILVCQQRNTLAVTNSGGSGNEENEENNNDNNDNSQDCETVEIIATGSQIKVSNLTTPNSVVKVFSENFDLIFECAGNCGTEAIITDLIDGNYQVNIDLFDENWVAICERIMPITLGSTSNSIGQTAPILQNNMQQPTSNIVTSTVSFYPNPANNELLLDLQGFSTQKTTVTIYNQLATAVWESRISTNQSKQLIDLTAINNGLYMVVIEVDGQLPIAKKLLIQKDRQ